MRIERVKVTKLFGYFEHTIDFKKKDRITIIHGPNGFGKTVLLKMIDAFFKRPSQMRSFPFETFEVKLDNGKTVKVSRISKDSTRKDEDIVHQGEAKLSFHLFEKKQILDKWEPKSIIDRERMRWPLSMVDREIPFLERVGRESWLDKTTGMTLDFDEVLSKYGEFLPPTGSVSKSALPKWLSEITSSFHVHLVETQRLLSLTAKKWRYPEEKPSEFEPAVLKYSKELSSAIESNLAEYGALSQSLDRTFPARLVERDIPIMSEIEIRKKLSDLEEKRKNLIKIGLLDSGEEFRFTAPTQLDERTKLVLSVYAKDAEEKLNIFNDLAAKINLLIEIINGRFLYKKMFVDKKSGIIFKTQDDQPLPLIKLSSGEQHELVLLYELLFKVKECSLILIDEPELSLHVAWQKKFLPDLQEITRLVSLDILIATHSPQIINDRWDLTVELEGPKL